MKRKLFLATTIALMSMGAMVQPESMPLGTSGLFVSSVLANEAVSWRPAGDFSNGLAAVRTADGKYGYIDTNGNVVIELDPRWEVVGSFSEGLLGVTHYLESGSTESGFIDTSGNVVIAPQWNYVNPFSEGLAIVIVDWKYGYIDTSGNVVIEPQFENASNFSNGLAAVHTFDGEAVYIDTSGNVVFELAPQLRAESLYFSDGLLLVSADGKYGFIDTSGNVVIEPQFDRASDFSEGLALAWKDGKPGFIDTSGNLVIESQWEQASSFSDGLASVFTYMQVGYIDTSGNVVIEPQFDSASSFSDGLASVYANWKYGYIDTSGNVVIAPQFDSASSFSDGFARVEKDGESFFIDKNGNALSVGGASAPAPAATQQGISVVINGAPVQFEQEPMIVDGRVLAPLRALCEQIGATVDWEGATQSITIIKDGVTLGLKIGSTTMTVSNGTSIELEFAPQIYNGRTMLPVGTLVEKLGGTVSVDGDTFTLTIN